MAVISPFHSYLPSHECTDEGNPENVVLNNSLTNEAMAAHINSSQQEVAVHLNHSTKCEMKKAPLVLGFKL